MEIEVFELLETRDVEGLGYPEENHKWFLVKNYKNTPTNHAVIDNFACTIYNNKKFSFTKVNEEFAISFFRKTRKTNSEYLRENPADFFRYSGIKDYICVYNFFSEDLAYLSYYKNGSVERRYTNFKCH